MRVDIALINRGLPAEANPRGPPGIAGHWHLGAEARARRSRSPVTQISHLRALNAYSPHQASGRTVGNKAKL